MKLSIESVLNIEGERQDFTGELDLSWVKRHGETLFPDPLAIAGSAVNRTDVVVLRYQISGRLCYSCDRCLMQTEKDLCESFEHTVVRSLADEELDDVFWVAPEGFVLLDEIAGSDLQLLLPQILLCRADCKGLCPI
ncbi:MAG: hypothetical protein RR320_07345, partial [Oscillospiraceae bacterium]